MLKVVLADDEKKICQLLQIIVDWKNLGFEIVEVVHNGRDALEAVKRHQPDVIVTDIRMPECSGLELLHRVREEKQDIDVVIISGYRQFEYAHTALQDGAEDYLLKPLKQEELTGILMRLSDKLGKEAALEFQLKKSGERQQEQLMDALQNAVERQQPFLDAADAYFMSPYLEQYKKYSRIVPDVRALMTAEYPDPEPGYPDGSKREYDLVTPGTRTRFEKLNWYHRSEAARLRSLERVKDLPVEAVFAEVTYLELSPEDVSKGSGLVRLCDALGIPVSRSIAVGDSDNDLEMLRTAGLAAAMGNANETVKKTADVITSDNNHDGCAEVILRYLLAE